MNSSRKFERNLLRRGVYLRRALRNESMLGDQERKKGHFKAKETVDTGMRQHRACGKVFTDSLIQLILMACLRHFRHCAQQMDMTGLGGDALEDEADTRPWGWACVSCKEVRTLLCKLWGGPEGFPSSGK